MNTHKQEQNGNLTDQTTELSAFDALRQHDRWVGYRLPDKTPLSPHSGRNAKVSSVTTWGSHDQALKAMEKYNFDGVGFVFGEKLGIVGTDLDKCRNPETGEIDLAALEIVKTLDSYTEVSPSGAGLHIYTYAEIPRNVGATDGCMVEMYCKGRYFTWTGDHLEGTPTTIKQRPPETIKVYQDALASRQRAAIPEPVTPAAGNASGQERHEMTLDRLAPHRADSYASWIAVGMALQDELGDAGLPLWDRWSQQGGKYKPGECERKWKSFDPGEGVTWGTVVHWANEDNPLPARPKAERPPEPEAPPMVLTPQGLKKAPEEIRLKTALDILNTEYPDPVWVIEDILPEGLCILGGPMKIGKSLLLMQMASAVSTGGQVLNFKARQGRVLFLDLEGDEPSFKDRMKNQGWPASGAENVDTMHAPQFFEEIGALTGQGLAHFAALVARKKYILVIVDTLAIATMIDERADVYDNKGYTATVRILRAMHQLAQTYHCSVVVTGHHSKAIVRGTYEPNPFIDVLGNVGVGGTVHTAWGIYKVAGQSERKLIVGSRAFNVEKIELGIKIDGLTATWLNAGDWELIARTDREKKIIDALYTWGDLSITGLVGHTGLAKPHVSTIVAKLLADKVVTADKQGREKIVSLPKRDLQVGNSSNSGNYSNSSNSGNNT